MQMTDPTKSAAPASSFFQPGYAHLPLNALNSFSLFDLFDDALADMFCLDTLVHGTSPRNYYSIIWTGANPEKAARETTGMRAYHSFTGSTPYNDEAGARFHLTADITDEAEECPQVVTDGIHGLGKKVLPRLYAAATTIGEQNYPKKVSEKESWDWSDYATFAKGFVLSQFSPTLKFRFNPELGATAPAISMGGDICYATQPIGAEYIGLYGTLMQSLQGDLWGRIQENPSKFIVGVAKLIGSVALTVIVAYGVLYSNAVIFTIVRAFLMYEAVVCVGRVVVPILFGCLGEIAVEGKDKPDGTKPSAPLRVSAFDQTLHSNLPPAFRPPGMGEESPAASPTAAERKAEFDAWNAKQKERLADMGTRLDRLQEKERKEQEARAQQAQKPVSEQPKQQSVFNLVPDSDDELGVSPDSPMAHPQYPTLRPMDRDDEEFETDVAQHAQPFAPVASDDGDTDLFSKDKKMDGLLPKMQKPVTLADAMPALNKLVDETAAELNAQQPGLGDIAKQDMTSKMPKIGVGEDVTEDAPAEEASLTT